MKKALKNPGVQAFVASIICIILGLLIGYVVLLVINPEGAAESILNVIKNFFTWSKPKTQLKQFGNTLAKTMPLLMCSLSILFAYKVGLFNIGTAGQYVAGACACLYAALAWGWSWLPCMLFAIVAGAVLGAVVGVLKAYCNVNEVISGIMLNWISLYTANTLLSKVKEVASPYTMYLTDLNPSSLLPNAGLDTLFNKNKYVTIAVPLALITARYAGMKENRNIILTLAIAGGLAGLGAAMLYLTGYMRWECTQSSVPGMGFNGIAAAFLGGLNPIGAIFSSFFIQHITDGGQYVNTNFYSSQISDLISSVIIYLCGFVLFIKITMTNMINRSEEKKSRKLKAAEAASGKEGDK